MISSDKNIETISQLIVEVKKYAEIKGKCLQIDFVSKLSKLLAALVVVSALFLLGAIALVFISMLAASLLEPIVGGTAYSYAIIVAFYALLGITVYIKRQAWIEAPIVNFLGQLFLEEQSDSPQAGNPKTKEPSNRPIK